MKIKYLWYTEVAIPKLIIYFQKKKKAVFKGNQFYLLFLFACKKQTSHSMETT